MDMRIRGPPLGVNLGCRFPSAPRVDGAENGSDEGDDPQDEEAF
jgi:hypothetical protein